MTWIGCGKAHRARRSSGGQFEPATRKSPRGSRVAASRASFAVVGRTGACLGREGFSALEWSLVGTIIGLLMAWIISVGSVGFDRSKDISCTSNLKQLGGAMIMYAADFDGYGPRNRDQLSYLNTYTRNPLAFKCPAVTHKGQLPVEAGDYVFRVRISMDDQAERFIVMDDSPRRHTFKTWIGVCLDGSTRQRPAREWAGMPAFGWAKPSNINQQLQEWRPPTSGRRTPWMGPMPTGPPFLGHGQSMGAGPPMPAQPPRQ